MNVLATLYRPRESFVECRRPGAWQRVAVALSLGVVAGIITAWQTDAIAARGTAEFPAWLDFEYWWSAARLVLTGRDPYTSMGPDGHFVLPAYFVYPLPAALVTVPFAVFSLHVAAGMFVGVGIALAAYGVTQFGWRGLFALISAPAVTLVENAQWAPFLLAASLLPPLSWLLIVKPTLAVALAAYRPTWWLVNGGLAMLILSVAVQPSWPLDWIGALKMSPDRNQYYPPVLLGPGFLCLLALFRWRRPEARVLALLALVPQNYYWYDQLVLFLIPRTLREFVALFATGHIARVLASHWAEWGAGQAETSLAFAPYVIWGMYMPSLLMVLSRQNVGSVPRRIERWSQSRRLPGWLIGSAAEERASSEVEASRPPPAPPGDPNGSAWWRNGRSPADA